MVLRDHEGRTSDGKVRWYEHCLNALAAEAMACRDGMQYARERGVQRFPLEIDCHVLVTLWEKRTSLKSKIDPLLHQMAHECARLVSCNRPVEEWLITPPALQDIISDDCNPLHG